MSDTRSANSMSYMGPSFSESYGRPEPDLRGYLRVLRRRKWVIVITALAAAGAALGVSMMQTKKYSATAQVLLEPNQSVQLGSASSSSGNNLTPTDVQTEVQLMTSAPVQMAVSKSVGTTKAPPVSVTPVGLTNVIDVVATDRDARQAARIANAYANSYISFRRSGEVNDMLAAASQIQSKISDVDSQITLLDTQLAKAPPAQQASLQAQRAALVNQEAAFKAEQAQFQVTSALQNGGAQVVTPAVAPTSPSSPRPKRDLAIGLAVGLILGVGAAFGFEYLDDSIRTKDDLEHAGGGLTVLGLIPEVGGWKDGDAPHVAALSSSRSSVAEAYRSLRTSIQFVGIDRPIRILQVTSPNAQEGKTTTLANLGVVLAQAGQRVVMVCCDLRRPRLHEFFGLSNAVGFTSVLLGQSSLADAVQPAMPDQDHLWLLASGPPPPNPSELLASPLSGEVLRTLASEFDLVLVDSPPVLPVTDAAVLSAHADASVLVTVVGLTTGKQIERTVEVLGQVNAALVGTVLNGVADGAAYGYSFRYGRYGSYASQDSDLSDRVPVRRDASILHRQGG